MSEKTQEEIENEEIEHETEIEEESEEQKLISELQEKVDQTMRAYASCENEKKIIEKQKTHAIEFAQEKFAKDLLPIVDTLELAIKNVPETDDQSLKQVVEGVELTLKKMIETFENHGIEEVEHEAFDPSFHQAIQQVESDVHEDGAIVEVFQKGYKLKNRVIRPSMVTVAKNK